MPSTNIFEELSDESHSENGFKDLFLDGTSLVKVTLPKNVTKLLVVCEKYIERVNIHTYQPAGETYKQMYTCKNENCPLCASGEKLDSRLLLPVYNVESGEMEVFPFPKHTEFKSLYPQIIAVLKEQELPVLIRVFHGEKFTYSVTIGAIPENIVASIKAKSEAFMSAVKDGTIKLSGVIKVIDNNLLNDRNLQRKLMFAGHDYKAFLTEEKVTFEDEEFAM